MTIRDCNGTEIPVEGYVHGIRASADSDVRRWNMSLEGTLISADAVADSQGWSTSGLHHSFRDVPIGDLRFRAHLVARGTLEMRGVLVWQASMLRAGMEVGWGVDPYPFRPMPPAQQGAVIRQAEFELELEEARRRVAPDAPSRLSCLWLADDNTDGRNYVHRLVGSDAFILPVEIVRALRTARLDVRWLEHVPVHGAAATEGYWRGRAPGPGALWETLVDGTIRCSDDEALALLRNHVKTHTPFRDPPPNRD